MPGLQIAPIVPFDSERQDALPARRAKKRRPRNGASSGPPMNFERIYKLHSRRVYYLCLRMVGNPAEAEDLTQDVFLQVYRKMNTFRGDSAFTTWLHRVAVNVVLMRLRKKAIPVTSLEARHESEDEGTVPRPEEGVMDPALASLPDHLWLERALQQLPNRSRVALFLHYVEGYRHREIARLMGYSVHNSKSQLRRARIRLRQLIGMERYQRRRSRGLAEGRASNDD
jgi:RNA polymerase sigma-70 factor, ECF subfamily